MPNFLENQFKDAGKRLMNVTEGSESIFLRRFKATFGVSVSICSMSWQKIKPNLFHDFTEVHFLWALHFLKCYNTENVNRSFAKCDEKTFRTRVWKVVEELSCMNVVRIIICGRKCNFN